MSSDISIPDCGVKYILFQRTPYLVIPKTILYKAMRKFTPWPNINTVVSLESFFRKSKVKRLFNEDMLKEYKNIKSWLPDRCSRVLDIGCGVAGIDVFLHRHFNCDRSMEFYLLDKTSVNRKVYYFFERYGAFYNSLEVAEQILSQNGIPRENIHLIEVPSDFWISVQSGLDLVVSLISWGYHYPVSTYIDQVYDLLREGGYLIMDIREGTDGEKEVEEKFGKIQIISDADKIRISAIK